MEKIVQKSYEGERPLFCSRDLQIYDTVFGEGESPLKESENIEIYNTLFQWKYPLWYCKNILMRECTLFQMARAGVWYTEDIVIEDTVIEAPKNLRRSKHVTLHNVTFPNAEETLWSCENVEMKHVTANGDYFGMNCGNVQATDLTLTGNYSFDGARDVEIHNSRLLSKDAFWNSENVSVYDSFISGEYLGWNARNLTFVNCTIESLQGLCYIDNLVMKNCKLINTTLAFEYSSVDLEITGKIDSVKNPSSGIIRADYIEELIMEEDKIDSSRTKIICGSLKK